MAELKANLSSYLRRVKAGSEVVITEHGSPVAKIVPLSPPERNESRERRLVKAGLLIPARSKMPTWLLRSSKSPADTRAGTSVLAALVQERREGR